jgi:toxin HigB-1
VELVKTEGLEKVRKVPGYHDEPLRGQREGQRSIRLNIAYRALYTIEKDESGDDVVKFVSVFEVTKHEY